VCSYRLTSGRGCRRLTRETRRAAAPCPTPTARGSCRRQPPADPPAWGDRRMSPPANSAMPTWRACGVAGEVRRKWAGATPHRRGTGGQGLWATELGLSASMGSGGTVRGYARAVALVVAARAAGCCGLVAAGGRPPRGGAYPGAALYKRAARRGTRCGAARHPDHRLLSASVVPAPRRSPLSTFSSLFVNFSGILCRIGSSAGFVLTGGGVGFCRPFRAWQIGPAGSIDPRSTKPAEDPRIFTTTLHSISARRLPIHQTECPFCWLF